MSYIPQQERPERAVSAANRLCTLPDFQALCDVWISDLVDKQADMLTLDAPAMYRAQGAAAELRRILESVYGANAVADKMAKATAQTVQHGREMFIQEPARASWQA